MRRGACRRLGSIADAKDADHREDPRPRALTRTGPRRGLPRDQPAIAPAAQIGFPNAEAFARQAPRVRRFDPARPWSTRLPTSALTARPLRSEARPAERDRGDPPRQSASGPRSAPAAERSCAVSASSRPRSEAERLQRSAPHRFTVVLHGTAQRLRRIGSADANQLLRAFPRPCPISTLRSNDRRANELTLDLRQRIGPGEAAERVHDGAVRDRCADVSARPRSIVCSGPARRRHGRVVAVHRPAAYAQFVQTTRGDSSLPAAGRDGRQQRGSGRLACHRVAARQQAQTECCEAVQVPRAEDVPVCDGRGPAVGVRRSPARPSASSGLRGDQVHRCRVSAGDERLRAPSSAPRPSARRPSPRDETRAVSSTSEHGAIRETPSPASARSPPVHRRCPEDQRSVDRHVRPTRRARADPVPPRKRSASATDATIGRTGVHAWLRGEETEEFRRSPSAVPSPRCVRHLRRDRSGPARRRVFSAIALKRTFPHLDVTIVEFVEDPGESRWRGDERRTIVPFSSTSSSDSTSTRCGPRSGRRFKLGIRFFWATPGGRMVRLPFVSPRSPSR